VSAYCTADLRLSDRPDDRFEFSLVGQNLLDGQHPEQSSAPFAVVAEVPRGIYAKILWRF
jgi:iron complex outermembrane recepter protein